MMQLDSKFMSKLDEHTPRLLKRFHSKGGSMGLKLQAILLMAPSNPRIDMSRGLVIRCLMVYLGESTDQLLKEYDVPCYELFTEQLKDNLKISERSSLIIDRVSVDDFKRILTKTTCHRTLLQQG